MKQTQPQPLDIVTVPLEGANLIEASAGTGKTFAITNLYIRLLIEKELKVSEILVVTFTEAATQELKNRIRKNISDALLSLEDTNSSAPDDPVNMIIQKNIRSKPKELIAATLKRALVSFDEASVFTIHGFCKRLLSDSCFETHTFFDTELITDQTVFITETVLDFWRITFSNQDPLLSAMAVKNRITPRFFENLAADLINKPLMNIIPESADTSFEETATLFEALATEWKKSETAVRNLFSNTEILKKDDAEALPQRLNQLNFVFKNVPTAEGLNTIALFTPDSIQKAVFKKHMDSAPKHPFFSLCEAFCRLEKKLFIKIKLDFADYFRTTFYKRKRFRNIQSFDDLLLNVYTVLSSEKGAVLLNHTRNIFSAAMIDEFQDTDPVQYHIFNTIFRTDAHIMFMIGDPKQSIYGFRGADVFSYFDAAEKTDPHRKFTLAENYRSETECVKAVNSLFSQKQNVFALEEKLAFNPVNHTPGSKGNKRKLQVADGSGGGVVLWRYGNADRKEINKVNARSKAVHDTTREVAVLLEKARLGETPVNPSDIAILVTRNEDAVLFIEHFTHFNIPAVIKKTGSIFKSPQAKELALILQACASPSDRRRVFTALSTDIIGCHADTLEQFLTEASQLAAYEAHVKNFAAYGELWRQGEFMKMFRKFTAEYDIRKQLLNFTDGERRLTNLFHLAEILHTVSFENRLGCESLLDWFCTRIVSENNLPGAEEEELRLERDDEALQILTVHKSKGLEYPIVFLPFMWQPALERKGSAFFHKNSRLYLDIGSEEEKQNRYLADKENLSEQVRNLYVGLTRAVNRCYLVYGNIGRDDNVLKYFFSPSDTQNAQEAPPLHGVVCSDPGSAEPKPYTPPADGAAALSLKTFQAESCLSDPFGVCSFSRITASAYTPAAQDEEVQETVQDEPVWDIPSEVPEDEPEGVFAFPKGATAGSCVHEIFETIDFTLTDPAEAKAIIRKTLQKYALGQTSDNSRVDTLFSMANNVLSAPLLPENNRLCLRHISPENRCHELHFFHPLRRIEPETLSGIFRSAGLDFKRFPEKLESLTFTPVHGFMQGFIDLIFYFENRYYILDWKTNHLGNSYTDYETDKLIKPMEESLYILQYYIYTVALHRYLQTRVKDYCYEKNFGGIFYLFLRGITPELPGNGIYHDLPAFEAVKELDRLAIPDPD